MPDGRINTYKYDPFGRRIEKNVNGTITKYLYDNEDILLEYDATNTVMARYTHGPGIDEPFAMEKNNQMYYYHADGLGSIIALSGQSGALVQTYDYDSFGNPKTTTQTVTQPYTYTSREYDPETGLYFYRARQYDAKTGRFLQKDPIGFSAGDVNVYRYVGNSPTNATDPSGLIIWVCSRPVTGWLKYLTFGQGMHSFLWDPDSKKSCGTSWSSDGGDPTCHQEKEPDLKNCTIAWESTGKEKEIMDCCQKTMNSGIYLPGIRDCHSAVDRCIEASGGKMRRSAPGGRLGRNCITCW